jgi:uncharacterized protein YciI
MKKFIFLPIFCAGAFLLWAKTPVITADHAFTDTSHMKQYWLVFLLKGPTRSQDSLTAENIQKAHIANIQRLAKEGSVVMAGPMGYDKDLRGIFILDAKDSASAATLVNTDPAVKSGRLRFELHPWWTQTGTYIFKQFLNWDR